MAKLVFPKISDLWAHGAGRMRRWNWGILSIVLLALLIRLVLIPQGLPLLLHEDEPIYFDHALQVGRGDFDLHYFKKPSFFIYFYAAFYFVLYLYTPFLKWASFEHAFWQDPTMVAWVGRGITVAFAAGSVWLLHKIGKRAFAPAVGLAAAFLLAVDFTHLKVSPIVISDVPALFFILLTAWFALAVSERGQWRDYLLCGVSVALAMSFKYNFFTAAFLVAGHFVRYFEGRASGGWKAALADKRFWTALAVVPAVFFLLNPYSLINFQAFYEDLLYEKRHVLTRETTAQHDYVKWLVSFDDIFLKILPRAMGWPLYIAGLLGGIFLAWKKPFRAAVLLSFPLVFLLVVCQFQLINAKYLLPVFPFWFLSAAFLARELTVAANRKWFAASHAQVVNVAFILLVGVFAFESIKESKDYLRLSFQSDTRLEARNFLYLLMNDGDSVMVEPGTFALLSDHYRPHLHMASLKKPVHPGEKPSFTDLVQPEMGTLEFTRYEPDYFLLYFKARRLEKGKYEMAYNPPEYYRYLSDRYEFRALFSPNPVPLTNGQLSDFYNREGFAGLYAHIQDAKGKRDRPGPLLLLLQKKGLHQPPN